jgi:hypothetical protein
VTQKRARGPEWPSGPQIRGSGGEPATYSTAYARSARLRQPRLPQVFSDWCGENAVALLLPLELNADIVAWICTVVKSSGEMCGIENITTLERVLKQRRTKLRFPTELEWEKALLTARVLFRTYEQGVVS